MLNSVASTNKIVATSYVHNQLYYNQPGQRASGWPHFFPRSNPIDGYFKAAAFGIASFLQSAQDLKGSTQQMLKPDTSAFPMRTTASSDNTSVTASASKGASLKSYQVQVNQTASAQVNSGSLLSRSAPAAINSGTNQLKITVGGKTTHVSAFISNGDTNEQALGKLRDSINKANTGVTAGIVSDSATGQRKLELKSDLTGTDSGFVVADETGNAAAFTGIGQITSAATNASYTINSGAVRTSQSNTIELEKGNATATLLKPTTGNVKIQVKPDQTSAIKQVKQMVTDYNAVLGRLSEAGSYVNPSVKRSLENNVRGYDTIGISKKADGTLQLDEAKLKESLNSRYEQTREALTGSSGLADKLSKAASRYENVPPSTLLNSRIRNMQMFAAYPPSSGVYSQTAGNGLLYDGTF